MGMINILVTLDQNYIPQLKVLLTSVMVNNPDESFSVYLLHSSIPEKEIRSIGAWCLEHGWELHAVTVDDTMFRGSSCFTPVPKGDVLSSPCSSDSSGKRGENYLS